MGALNGGVSSGSAEGQICATGDQGNRQGPAPCQLCGWMLIVARGPRKSTEG